LRLCSRSRPGLSEDCHYCPQAARYHTGVEAGAILPLGEVIAAARAAKENGATRFCMGAAWREPKARDIEKIQAMVSAVKALGLETCALVLLGYPKEKFRSRFVNPFIEFAKGKLADTGR